jgi:hypothetical protein
MKIYKYQIPTSPTVLEMPIGANIRCVHSQRENIFLWAEVDENQFETELRTFRTYFTGWDIMPGGWYVGTAFVHSDTLVYHVYGYPTEM